MTRQDRPKFQTSFWPTAATLVGLAILLSLGTWQFGRYRQKLRLEAERHQRMKGDPVRVDSLAEFKKKTGPFQPVVLRGHLDPHYTFLFAHRFHNGKPGYWIGGVLRFESGKGAVLVNRGWVYIQDAKRFARTPPSDKPQIFEGLVDQPEQIIADTDMRKRLAAGKVVLENHSTDWETFDLKAVSDALPFDMPDQPTVVILGPKHSGNPYPVASFDYITHPYLTSERHLSYATFWFATAIALLSMYLAAGFGYLGSREPMPRND